MGSENENVMNEKKPVRKKWLTIRLNDKEEKKLLELFQKAVSVSLSEYARDVLLRKPVALFYRNRSADDFLEEMILLRKELNAIGINFNQAVHRLHTIDKAQDIKGWVIWAESNREQLINKVGAIEAKMNEIYQLWLRK